MKRFFDYPDTLLNYFDEIDRRFGPVNRPTVIPAEVEPVTTDLSDVRAVIWDVYGTICGVDLGDLEQSMQQEERMLPAAQAVIDEFHLQEPLNEIEPDLPVAHTLRDLYFGLIDESHQQSRRTGIASPEVLIERIWMDILSRCIRQGWKSLWREPLLHTAYRVGYFFDWSLQKTYLYENAAHVLRTLRRAGKLQGIISNAQFYTPLHLQRLLHAELPADSFELEDIFTEPLVFFSYEVGFSKPNPGSFQRAIEFLGRQAIMPEDMVYIGNDMLNDVWTASQCGIHTILFAADTNQTTLREDDPRCRDLQPDAVVRSMDEIVTILC